jgi:hypothetical protein
MLHTLFIFQLPSPLSIHYNPSIHLIRPCFLYIIVFTSALGPFMYIDICPLVS